ncbi:MULTISPECIES: hypothetical protein [Halobacterium]|uniref:hypothetical protein n=1 Tax=Halobacterium TaxID=2239 RepID=UPI000A9230FC|nr:MULTISPECIES: hypothetical protein [Halobacterium]MCG1002865.1 hypothetical protein [Halobacterium noricense]
MSSRSPQFRLVVEENYSERTLIEDDSLENVLEQAAEKAGRGDLWEVLEDL